VQIPRGPDTPTRGIAPPTKDGILVPTVELPRWKTPTDPLSGVEGTTNAPTFASEAPSESRAVAPGPPGPEPDEFGPQVYDEAPVAVERPMPRYPDWARDAGISGRVVLHALVGADGQVKRITVVRDVTGLTSAARDALYRWVFRPARANGHAVPVWVEVPIEFKL
jgi:protein TonB